MFGFGKKRFLGVDIGTSTIKMVEIKISGNKPVLSNYAWVQLGDIMGDRDLKSSFFTTVFPQCMQKMIKEAGIKSQKAFVSIPAFGGLIMLIEFPEMSDEDLSQAIKFEAHKYIPTSLDEVVLSWDVLKKKAADKRLVENGKEAVAVDSEAVKDATTKIQVLLVAAPKNKVERYEKLTSQVGLKLETIEIESFSLARSLVGGDQGNFMIVDIGSRVCNIILLEKGMIKVNRNIDAGGKDITNIISKSMGVDEMRAENLKTSGKDFLGGDASMSFAPLDLIIGEIKRVLMAYYKNESNQKIDAVILSGGTANFSGIAEYFSKALNIRTIVGNPLGRIEYDRKLEPKVEEIRTQFSVAIGLALKGVEDYFRK